MYVKSSSLPIVTIRTVRTSAHVKLDTLGTGKRVQVTTCISYYSTIIHRGRGNYPQSLKLAFIIVYTIRLLGAVRIITASFLRSSQSLQVESTTCVVCGV